MKYVHLIWRNLLHKKLRTTLTALSIFVAFLLYGLLCALEMAFNLGVEIAVANRLIATNKVAFTESLPITYQERIQRLPGVVAATHLTWFGGLYQNDPKNFLPTFPVEAEAYLAMFPEFIVSPEDRQRWLSTRNGVLLGRLTAERLGWQVGKRVPLTSPIWGEPPNQPAWEFEIAGIYDGARSVTDTTQFLFHYDYFDEGRARNKGQVGWYSIKIEDPGRAVEIAQQVDALFANSPYETVTVPEAVWMQSFAKMIGDIGVILLAVLSAVFFTILLVTGNTMAQAVRERTEEIGVLKALGFSSTLVLGLVMAESLLLAGLGGFAGLGAAWLLTAGDSPVPQIFPIFHIPPSGLAVGAALVLVLGVAAGLFPAVQAMRLRVAAALRAGA